jgi:hypothetical protein
MISPVRLTEGPPGRLLVSDYPARAVFVVDKQSTEILWTINIDGTATKRQGASRFTR